MINIIQQCLFTVKWNCYSAKSKAVSLPFVSACTVNNSAIFHNIKLSITRLQCKSVTSMTNGKSSLHGNGTDWQSRACSGAMGGQMVSQTLMHKVTTVPVSLHCTDTINYRRGKMVIATGRFSRLPSFFLFLQLPVEWVGR